MVGYLMMGLPRSIRQLLRGSRKRRFWRPIERYDDFTIEIYLKLVTQFCFFQLGFYPFTQAILKSKKLRHEIGQGEETDQTRMMRDLESEYNSLKETCRDEGKNLCLIFIFGDM